MYASDSEAGCLNLDSLHRLTSQPTLGILWFTATPPTTDFPLLSFPESEVLLRRQKCEKIFTRMQNSFFFTNAQVFCPQVISNWQFWLEEQQKIWSYERFDGKFSDLMLPRIISERKHQLQEVESVPELELHLQNPEPGSPADEVEFVTHSSGEHGHFTKEQRLELVRDLLLEEDSQNAPIMEKTHCIYKYVYAGKCNIMVGMIKKVNYDETGTNVASIEVLQCPPKGARRENLYIDISPDDAFNLDYRIRVTDILERSMLLAYNLEMTAGGKFCKKRKSGKYGHSAYFVAQTQIGQFYSALGDK
jgi:hypothetical protein